MTTALRFCALLLAACVLLTAAPPARALMGMEEAIMYDNNVLDTVRRQLEGLDIASIREKQGLIMERSMQQLQDSIAKGELTYEALTAFYLDRIARYDKAPGGLNAVVSVNPHALEQARQLDAAGKTATSPVYGMPVLVKDNINTRHLPTSAGTYALKDFTPAQDAQVVQRLQEAGAILLGKSNLSEMANFMGEHMPDGYSAAVGQTRNPFDPGMMSPQGSSSGSGAAVAANLCAAALGTETTGSIVAPSNIHSLVGFKPSLGRISTQGVVPLSSTMDSVGPMAKNVEDAVALYNAAAEPGQQLTLDRQVSLKGKRIGVLPGEGGDKLSAALEKLGAQPVPLSLDEAKMQWDNEFIMLQDFAADFAAYAAAHQAPVKSLAEMVAFNQQDLERRAKYGQSLLAKAAQTVTPQRDRVTAMVQTAQAFVDEWFTTQGLDAICFINNDYCDIPCAAGYPEITVPLGKNAFDEPMGATFFMRGNQDAALASLALAFEQGTLLRQLPERYQANP